MRIDRGGGSGGAEMLMRNVDTPGLPRQVRFHARDALSGGLLPPGAEVYEFEVVTGNAAWREGERFYLTPAQAERAYFATK
jgi:hypothetical protein